MILSVAGVSIVEGFDVAVAPWGGGFLRSKVAEEDQNFSELQRVLCFSNTLGAARFGGREGKVWRDAPTD
jgi:hypothetical protein